MMSRKLKPVSMLNIETGSLFPVSKFANIEKGVHSRFHLPFRDSFFVLACGSTSHNVTESANIETVRVSFTAKSF